MSVLKRIRRTLILIALIALIISFFLSAIYDALFVEHPTGRRYGSEITLNAGTTAEIGDDGERTLAKDLLLSNNNNSGKQCICSSRYATNLPTSNCNSCLFTGDNISSTHRIPDFVAPNYIAESKNVLQLSRSRDYMQIQDFATAAITLDVPLWVYVRVDTVAQQRFYDVVEPTGGGIVPYFTYEGYSDDIDRASRIGTAISLAALIIFVLIELRAMLYGSAPNRLPAPSAPDQPHSPSSGSRSPSSAPNPPTSGKPNPRRPSPHQPTPYAKARSIEAGADDLKERAKRRLDEEKAREDLRDEE